MVFTPTEIIGLVAIAVAVVLIGLGVTHLDQRVGKHSDEALEAEGQPESGEPVPTQPTPKSKRHR